ncbi:MAG: hypothetical protein NBV67_08135 [Tagaea sp.]|nr:hypothetical protein [Tagaea sp.]
MSRENRLNEWTTTPSNPPVPSLAASIMRWNTGRSSSRAEAPGSSNTSTTLQPLVSQ